MSEDERNGSPGNEADTLTQSMPQAIKRICVLVKVVASFGPKMAILECLILKNFLGREGGGGGGHVPDPPSCCVVVVMCPPKLKCLPPPMNKLSHCTERSGKYTREMLHHHEASLSEQYIMSWHTNHE